MCILPGVTPEGITLPFGVHTICKGRVKAPICMGEATLQIVEMWAEHGTGLNFVRVVISYLMGKYPTVPYSTHISWNIDWEGEVYIRLHQQGALRLSGIEPFGLPLSIYIPMEYRLGAELASSDKLGYCIYTW